MAATFYNEADLPIAPDDATVTLTLEHGVEVQRKIKAGDRVPVDLVDAWRTQTSAPLTDPEKKQLAAALEVEEKRLALERARLGLEGPEAKVEAQQGDPAPARRVPTRPIGVDLDEAVKQKDALKGQEARSDPSPEAPAVRRPKA